jgi:hypothetical protein
LSHINRNNAYINVAIISDIVETEKTVKLCLKIKKTGLNGKGDKENLKQIIADTSKTVGNMKKFSEKLNKRFLLFRLMF